MAELIAVLSGKGGTGKTSVCAGLAQALAKSGEKVLCIDCDVGLRNLDIALGLSQFSALSFQDVSEGGYSLDLAVRHPLFPTLAFLTAPVNCLADSIDMDAFGAMLDDARSKFSYVSLAIAAAFIFALLMGLKVLNVTIAPNFGWYLFCGFCLALSIIAPGMSFSTLLMPLGLYEPFVAGIGHLDMSVCIPGGIGALATIILFAKTVNALFENFYSVAFHAIIGVVIAATIMIIPFGGFTVSVTAAIVNVICLVAGIAAALVLDKFNQKFEVE